MCVNTGVPDSRPRHSPRPTRGDWVRNANRWAGPETEGDKVSGPNRTRKQRLWTTPTTPTQTRPRTQTRVAKRRRIRLGGVTPPTGSTGTPLRLEPRVTGRGRPVPHDGSSSRGLPLRGCRRSTCRTDPSTLWSFSLPLWKVKTVVVLRTPRGH